MTPATSAAATISTSTEHQTSHPTSFPPTADPTTYAQTADPTCNATPKIQHTHLQN